MRSKARLLEIVEDVRGSYWFAPASIALVGFCAGLLLVYLDALIGDKWLGRFEWFYGSRPERCSIAAVDCSGLYHHWSREWFSR